MGVGKTTVGQALKKQLANCAFLDGDWCWDMDPFSSNTGNKRDGHGKYMRSSEPVYPLLCV